MSGNTGADGPSRRREVTAAPVLPGGGARPRDGEAPPATPLHQLQTRLTWLFVFRAAVVTVLLATSLALRISTSDDMLAAGAKVLYGVVLASYASILAGALWLRRFGTRGVVALAYAQLFFDAVVATALVMAAGGVESVFVFLYSLTILNAAAVLHRRGALVLASGAALIYALVLVVETTGVLLPIGVEKPPALVQLAAPFLTNTSAMFLVAFLSGYLTDQLKKTSESLKAAHAQIEELELLYGAVLESLPSGVLTVDEHDRVVFLNNAGAEILGRPVADLVGAALQTAAPALARLQEPEGARFERSVVLPGRGERMLGGSVARLHGVEDLAGRVIVFQDLTELRRLQQDVARAERLAELGRFAAGLAHEVRNPLAAMIGCLQLLRNDARSGAPMGDESGRMLGIVHREAERLSNLVTEFLTYARPAPPRTTTTSLATLVKDTVAAAKGGPARDLELDVVEESDARVVCDPEQVKQVLWNLVVNATQAVASVEKPGAQRRIVLRVSAQGGAGVLTVDDDGPGVPEELRARIFEPFFTTRSDGTGLGLAASHQILAQQGGTIVVADSPLGGARFVVRLPSAASTPPLDATAAAG